MFFPLKINILISRTFFYLREISWNVDIKEVRPFISKKKKKNKRKGPGLHD